MATWLDVLSQDATDARGRFNPFKLARGFTSRGRAEIDRNTTLQEVAKQEELDRIAREQAARKVMAGGIDLSTYQPKTPEEVDMLNRALGPQVTRGNLTSQALGQRQGEQALSEATALQPARVAGASIANRGAEQAIRFNEQLQPGRVTQQETSNRILGTQDRLASELLPFQVGAADLGNQTSQEHLSLMRGLRPAQVRTAEAGANQAETAATRDAAMLPGMLEGQAIGNASGRFNLGRAHALLPLETESMTTRNRREFEDLVTQLATQEFTISDAQTRAQMNAQTLREAEETWPAREKAINSQPDPRVLAYLQQRPFIEYSQNPRLSDTVVRQDLGLPVDSSGAGMGSAGGQDKDLMDAIAAVAKARGYQAPQPAQPSATPMPNGGQVAPSVPSPAQPSAAGPNSRAKYALVNAIGQGARAVGRGILKVFENEPNSSELEAVRSAMATPEGRQRLQQLYPGLSPEDKARIDNAIRQLQGK